jgi:hypothetical protein
MEYAPKQDTCSQESPAATSPDFHQYTALDHTRPSIRLLHILKSTTPHEQIQCQLRHGTIGDTYVCLSYVWGETEADRLILINNRPVKIRENLWQFLHSARLKHIRKWWLWIDAVCINQYNVIERNHQVQQMGRIYMAAARVIYHGSD